MNGQNEERARLLNRQGRYDLAEKECLQAISTDIGNSSLRILLAHIHINQKRIEEAIEQAKQAIHLSPELARAHYTLCQAYFFSNRLSEAEAAIKAAIRLEVHQPSYHYYLGLIYLNRGENEEAKSQADIGLSIDPKNGSCLTVRAFALNRLYYRQESVEDFNDALSAEPSSWNIHFNFAKILQENNKPAEALKHYLIALRLNPKIEDGEEYLLKALKLNIWLSRTLNQLEKKVHDLYEIAGFTLLIISYPVLVYIPALFPLVLVIGIYPFFSDLIIESYFRLDPFVRCAIGKERIAASNIFLTILASSTLFLLLGKMLDNTLFYYSGLHLATLLFPLVGTMSMENYEKRKKSMRYGIALAISGPVIIFLSEIDPYYKLFFITYLVAFFIYFSYRYIKLPKDA